MRRRTMMLLVGLLVLGTASPASAATDRARPSVRITTADDAVLVGTPVAPPAGQELTQVRGAAADRGRGIRSVTITYCNGGARDSNGGYTCGGLYAVGTSPVSTVRASVACTNPTRRSCTWRAPVPTTPGRYLVFARAVDRAGNARSTGPIVVTVV